MILLINLLIAIMSDAYANLHVVRTGLYWGSIIQEMPKFVYDKHYGVLTMFPFVFSWISLLVLPILSCTSDREVLVTINNFCFKIVYFPVSIILLVIFMTANLILLPFAYIKTIVHKFLLLRRYRGIYQCQALVTFILLGVPILLCA